MHSKKTIDPNDRTNIYDGMTVGNLKKFIKEHNLPDDALIYIQRIEDFYFEKNNWSTVKKEGEDYYSAKRLIEGAKPGGKYHNKENYPNITDEHIQELLDIEKDLDEYKDEYIGIWSPVKYKDDDNLYLDAHY